MSRTITGAILWSFADQIGIQLVRIGISAILARLILPEEFGLLAMATAFIGVFEIFKNFGLGSSIIHKQTSNYKILDTIFWVTVLTSFVLSLLIFFLSGYFASFYGEPKVREISQALSLLFFLSSISIIPNALIRKDLRFKEFFFRNLIVLITSASVAIYLAWIGWGIWAPIIQNFISNLISIYINFKMVKWRPSFYFNLKDIHPHIKFSLPLLGESLSNYLVRNLDNILIGKYLGESQLGYYSRAYGLMTLPIRKITGSIARVMFPALSKIKNDKEKVWRYYLQLIEYTSFISFPLMLSFFVLADIIIITLYGTNWTPTIPIFRELAFVGALQSIGAYIGSLFQALGKTKLLFKLGLVVKPLMLIGIITGLLFGKITGLIIGYTLASTLSMILETHYILKILNKQASHFLLAFKTNILILLLSFLIPLLVSLHYQLNFILRTSLILLAWVFYIYLAKRFKSNAYFFMVSKLKKYVPYH